MLMVKINKSILMRRLIHTFGYVGVFTLAMALCLGVYALIIFTGTEILGYSFDLMQLAILASLVLTFIIVKFVDTKKVYGSIKQKERVSYIDFDNTLFESNKITREQADSIIRDFRSDCLPHGEYPDYVIIEFLNKKYGKRPE